MSLGWKAVFIDRLGGGVHDRQRTHLLPAGARVRSGPSLVETKVLLADGMQHRDLEALMVLLKHPDMRVRQEAQFELADRGATAIAPLASLLSEKPSIWAAPCHLGGLGQLLRRGSAADPLVEALYASHDEIRTQAAVLGESPQMHAFGRLATMVASDAHQSTFLRGIGLGPDGR